jgi:hypothetical protein
VLIIPSSWGSQLDGYLHHHHHTKQTPVHPSLCLLYFILLFTIATITAFILLLLLLFHYYHHYKTVTTDKPLRASLFLGAAELTTHLLRLINILWLPFVESRNLGFTFLEDCCDPLYLWVISIILLWLQFISQVTGISVCQHIRASSKILSHVL